MQRGVIFLKIITINGRNWRDLHTATLTKESTNRAITVFNIHNNQIHVQDSKEI